MIVQCCLRTRHLDAALEVVDWMRAAGHRPAASLLLDLVDAYGLAGDAGKVGCVWTAVDEFWPPSDVSDVMVGALRHLVKLRAPLLASQVLKEGVQAGCTVFAHADIQSLVEGCDEVA